MGQLFTIGKVIKIHTDPRTVKKLAFVETEEHIRHVVETLKWLYPNASKALYRAAELHDIGKKIYLQRDFAQSGGERDNRLTRQNLITDFYQQGSVEGTFTPAEAIKRYLTFLKHDHAKCFVVRQNPEDNDEDNDSEIVAARYQLDPPFGNHAASLQIDDLEYVPPDESNYVYSLVQLHHNFQVNKLIAAAAEHGEKIITDLYCLMTADQEGSRWAEYIVQKLEGGEEIPQGKFGFSEFAVEPTAEPIEILRNSEHIQGQVTLKAARRPDLGEKTLIVDYYLTDYNLHPDQYLLAKKGSKRS